MPENRDRDTVVRRVKLRPDGDEFVMMEVEVKREQGRVPIARGDRAEAVIDETIGTVSGAFAKIRKVAEVVFDELKAATNHPDEIQASFGLKLAGEIGAVFVKGSAEANFTVTLTWKK